MTLVDYLTVCANSRTLVRLQPEEARSLLALIAAANGILPDSNNFVARQALRDALTALEKP